MTADLHGPMIEFYRKHRISPVRQDITDLGAHFQRRSALYRHLGILPAFLAGRSVLEVGPGSGHNALYTASLEPGRYLLVEPNATAIEHLEQLFAGFPDLRRRFEIAPVLLGDFETEERFDFVFCEGMLAGMTEPRAHLRRLVQLTRPGGVLVITCADAVSVFPETLRRLLAQLLIDPAAPLAEQLATLEPVFAPHAATLAGMTRSAADWIVDNLVNPALMRGLFSIPEAVETVEGACTLYGTSPRFVTDWRWYKSLHGAARAFNAEALEQYWRCAHSFLDYRRVFPPRDAGENRRLAERCREAWRRMGDYELDRDPARLGPIRDALARVAAEVGAFSPDIASAVTEAAAFVGAGRPDGQALARSTALGPLFGRGQQYLSFVRAGRFDD
jgi:SAM-dependent methyltransferase